MSLAWQCGVILLHAPPSKQMPALADPLRGHLSGGGVTDTVDKTPTAQAGKAQENRLSPVALVKDRQWPMKTARRSL
jgi:hypothetical protein